MKNYAEAKERTWAPTGEFRDPPYSAAPCPRCNGPLPVGYPGARSRADNATEVCSDCGTEEAMVQFFAKRKETP